MSLAMSDRTRSHAAIDALRKAPRRPGEASFFWFDTHFGREAVKVLPGEHFVAGDDILVMTTLGSCIAACLWDRRAGVGGMNHFMLPDGAGASGRYGAYAMELLINEMMKRGAARGGLEAKVFGGGQVIAGMASVAVGERNTEFVLGYLRAEGIAVVGQDVLGDHARKVCFMPGSGKAMVKRIAGGTRDTDVAVERSAGGTVELF